MEMDTKISRVKELIAKREEIDAELGELLGGTVRERRIHPVGCGAQMTRLDLPTGVSCGFSTSSFEPGSVLPASGRSKAT